MREGREETEYMELWLNKLSGESGDAVDTQSRAGWKVQTVSEWSLCY